MNRQIGFKQLRVHSPEIVTKYTKTLPERSLNGNFLQNPILKNSLFGEEPCSAEGFGRRGEQPNEPKDVLQTSKPKG